MDTEELYDLPIFFKSERNVLLCRFRSKKQVRPFFDPSLELKTEKKDTVVESVGRTPFHSHGRGRMMPDVPNYHIPDKYRSSTVSMKLRCAATQEQQEEFQHRHHDPSQPQPPQFQELDFIGSADHCRPTLALRYIPPTSEAPAHIEAYPVIHAYAMSKVPAQQQVKTSAILSLEELEHRKKLRADRLAPRMGSHVSDADRFETADLGDEEVAGASDDDLGQVDLDLTANKEFYRDRDGAPKEEEEEEEAATARDGTDIRRGQPLDGYDQYRRKRVR
eukprot:gnl/Dysnectes_brevis/336_a371_4536.p1 GENE.gnl/Dysnectes_brevis/336_a371_4536~~gnl/Dysnectes_brevis/336_a371_4536.p1  ORF type:complete len:277 (+),score=43.04 gnl/Dysnectes_brevis/336_a371_4536:57-887(+)